MDMEKFEADCVAADARLEAHRARDKSKDDWPDLDKKCIIELCAKLLNRTYSDGYAAEKARLSKHAHLQTIARYATVAALCAIGVANHDWDDVQNAIGSLVTVSGAPDWRWARHQRQILYSLRPSNISPSRY